MKRNHRLTGSLVLLAFLFVASSMVSAPSAIAAEARKVNINTADASQLALLPRVGPAVAQRIIDFRKENGPFKSPEDLMLVQGIGEKTWQLIKPYVAVAGETSLKEKVKATKAPSKETKAPQKEGDR